MDTLYLDFIFNKTIVSRNFKSKFYNLSSQPERSDWQLCFISKEGMKCICAKIISKVNDIRQNCDIACPGDAKNMCGGSEFQAVYGSMIYNLCM